MQQDEQEMEFEPETDSDMRRTDTHDASHKIDKLKVELEKSKKERQEYLDGWQRSKADYVNLLKRSEEGTKHAKQQGVVKAVEALLPALDALERAKEHGEV